MRLEPLEDRRLLDGLLAEIDAVNATNHRYQLLMRTAGEGAIEPQATLVGLADIVRAYPANRLSFGDKLAAR